MRTFSSLFFHLFLFFFFFFLGGGGGYGYHTALLVYKGSLKFEILP